MGLSKKMLAVSLALFFVLGLTPQAASGTGVGSSLAQPAAELVNAATASETEYGHVDRVDSVGVYGWCWDPNSANASVRVHIYVYRLNGSQVYGIAADANVYRSDLASKGYGTGYHGFDVAIPWGTLPEEQLRVVVYEVNGADHHVIYDLNYNNRMQICVGGMQGPGVDDQGNLDYSVLINLHSWVDSNTISFCNNIGCSKAIYIVGSNSGGFIDCIKQSSYLAFTTHGYSDRLFCRLNWDDSYLTVDDINSLPNGTFSKTRCVLLNACYCGNRSNGQCIADAIHNKGAQVVVSFSGSTTVLYNGNQNPDGSHNVFNTMGGGLFSQAFTKYLGDGDTVRAAYGKALKIVIDNARSGDPDNQYGYENVTFSGNPDQAIKH